MFEVVIQAAVRGKVIARDVVKPIRKDVTAKCVSKIVFLLILIAACG